MGKGVAVGERRITDPVNRDSLPATTQEPKMSDKWLDALQEKVANCWEWHSPAMQIGFRYVPPDEGDDFWEVWAYPAVQEIVGGKEDGETVWCGFNFDVLAFLTDFESESLSMRTRQLEHPSE